jgi:hypothetical protein
MVVISAASARLELKAPYHPTLPFRARQIGGVWLGAAIGWVFPLEQEQALRAVCLDIWAVDGTIAAKGDVIDLQITVGEGVPFRSVFEAHETPIYLVGREIAASLRNLRGARPGRGIQFLAGKPRCLTSPSTWSTSIPDGAVFVIRDVPRCAAKRFREAVGGAGLVEESAPRVVKARVTLLKSAR